MSTAVPSQIESLRNIAIIAHVDHGKTTLVDKLLSQSGTLDRKAEGQERVMDSNDQEKERGITILAKNTAIRWQAPGAEQVYHINIVDTPGHADFGGEVERVMSMVDSVLLLVDAVDGPMPQTRFVTQKAFAQGLKPIVVVNKIDRPGARPDWVIDQIFDLFDNLGASDEQLDFPIIYCSALNGIAGLDPEDLADDMTPMLQSIVDIVEPPKVELDGPFQMQISALDYNSYVGVIGLGRIKRGSVKPNQQITVISTDGTTRKGKIGQVMTHMGLERVQTEQADAGDIVCITGVDSLSISDTLCDPAAVEALPPLSVDEPTVSMTFQVNDSPFAGRDGKYVTSRNIKERLDFSCAVFDAQARLVANAPHLPVHLGAMAESVGAIAKAHPNPVAGEVFATNDPSAGGSHLPDITVVTPVFHEGELVFYTASRGHHADVGGTTPGSMPPDSRTLAEEGVVFTAQRIVSGGRIDTDGILRTLGSGPYPARRPAENLADLEAQIAANRTGERLLAALVAEYGLETVRAYMQHVQDAADSAVRAAIGGLPNGDAKFVDHDDDGIPIAVTLHVDDDCMRVDFSGTGPAGPHNRNAPRAVTMAAVLYVLRTLVGTPIPLNHGCLRAVDVRIPKGCLLDPGPTHAVAAGNVETSQRIVDVLLAAAGKAAASTTPPSPKASRLAT